MPSLQLIMFSASLKVSSKLLYSYVTTRLSPKLDSMRGLDISRLETDSQASFSVFLRLFHIIFGKNFPNRYSSEIGG